MDIVFCWFSKKSGRLLSHLEIWSKLEEAADEVHYGIPRCITRFSLIQYTRRWQPGLTVTRETGSIAPTKKRDLIITFSGGWLSGGGACGASQGGGPYSGHRARHLDSQGDQGGQGEKGKSVNVTMAWIRIMTTMMTMMMMTFDHEHIWTRREIREVKVRRGARGTQLLQAPS
jgi:hypothetical protein